MTLASSIIDRRCTESIFAQRSGVNEIIFKYFILFSETLKSRQCYSDFAASGKPRLLPLRRVGNLVLLAVIHGKTSIIGQHPTNWIRLIFTKACDDTTLLYGKDEGYSGCVRFFVLVLSFD